MGSVVMLRAREHVAPLLSWGLRIEQGLPPARLGVGLLKVLYRLTTSLDEKLELSDEKQRQG